MDGCGEDDEKGGVIGRVIGWEAANKLDGEFDGVQSWQGHWEGRGHYIGREIARVRKKTRIWKRKCQGGSFWSGSWKGSINRPKYVIIGTENGRVTTRGPRHTGVK